EGDLCEFDGGGVEVHPVDVMQSEICLDLLQFLRAILWVHSLAELFLPAAQVLIRELPHRFDGERPGSQRGLAYGEIKDLSCARTLTVLIQQFFEGLPDGELGEHLWGVIRSRLLALPACEPVDKTAAPVEHRLLDAGDRVSCGDEVLLRDALNPVRGHHP